MTGRRRILLTVLTLVFAYASLSATLATVLAKSSPNKALLIWPFDGRIISAAAMDSLRQGNATDVPRATAPSAAKALIADPTTARAANVIGFQKELQNDRAGAMRAFAYAARLSARELQTHVWAINHASRRGDIDTVLKHYDMALRTSRDAPELLFPVLANALTDKLVRDRLARLARQSPWRRDFVVYAAQRAPQVQATMTFFSEAPTKGMLVEADVKDTLVSTAFAKNSAAMAWDYFRSTHPGARRDRSFDPDFAAMETGSTPFHWQIPDTATSDVRFEQSGNEQTRVVFDIANSLSGPILQQITALLPGVYRVNVKQDAQTLSLSNRMEWVISCQQLMTPIARLPFQSPQSGFAVPANCPFQVFALQIAPAAGVGPISGAVDRAEVIPFRRD